MVYGLVVMASLYVRYDELILLEVVVRVCKIWGRSCKHMDIGKDILWDNDGADHKGSVIFF